MKGENILIRNINPLVLQNYKNKILTLLRSIKYQVYSNPIKKTDCKTQMPFLVNCK